MGANRLKYFAAALLSVVIWGFFSIPLRLIQAYPSDQILYYRIFISLIITGSVILLFRRAQFRKDIEYIRSETPANRKKIIWLSLLAGVLITGNWFTFIYAVNHVSLKSAAFAYLVCPLITAFAGFFILKENLTRIKLAALGLACVSILLLAQGSLYEVLWSIAIAALYSFYLIIQRVMNKIDKFNMLGAHLLISALLVSPLYAGSMEVLPTELSFWLVILVVALLFTIIPLFLSLYALIGMPSSTLGIIIYLNPIIAFTVAIFYFHEEIDPHQFYAYSLLLIAIVLFNWAILKQLLFKNQAADASTETVI